MTALRALATYNDDRTPGAVLTAYSSLDGAQKRDALNTLVSRPAFAKPLRYSIRISSVVTMRVRRWLAVQLNTPACQGSRGRAMAIQ